MCMSAKSAGLRCVNAAVNTTKTTTEAARLEALSLAVSAAVRLVAARWAAASVAVTLVAVVPGRDGNLEIQDLTDEIQN